VQHKRSRDPATARRCPRRRRRFPDGRLLPSRLLLGHRAVLAILPARASLTNHTLSLRAKRGIFQNVSVRKCPSGSPRRFAPRDDGIISTSLTQPQLSRCRVREGYYLRQLAAAVPDEQPWRCWGLDISNGPCCRREAGQASQLGGWAATPSCRCCRARWIACCACRLPRVRGVARVLKPGGGWCRSMPGRTICANCARSSTQPETGTHAECQPRRLSRLPTETLPLLNRADKAPGRLPTCWP